MSEKKPSANTETPKAEQKTLDKPVKKEQTPKVKPAAQEIKAVTPTQVSKVAILALLIAMIAAAGVGGVYYWHVQEQQKLEQRILAEQLTNLDGVEKSVQSLLAKQQQESLTAVKQLLDEREQSANARIKHLEQTIARLGQNQPTDWLIHEAEYLIRVAGRTIWLEKDTQAAIALLTDADQRLNELNDPNFLPVRKLIFKDIEQLKLLPSLDTEQVILTLIGLQQQITSLQLNLPSTNPHTESEDLELSENLSDWKENIAKTGRKFLETFVVIHHKEGDLTPLISPQQQTMLIQNLELKIQQAQWAAKEGNTKLYQLALTNIEDWVKTYFEKEAITNQKFIESINSLKNKQIDYSYPNAVSSLPAIRKIIAAKSQPTGPVDNNDNQDEAQL